MQVSMRVLTRILWIVLSALSSALLLLPTSAFACSCMFSSFDIYAIDGKIPSNLHGIPTWGIMYPETAEDDISLERRVNNEWVNAPFQTTVLDSFGDQTYGIHIIYVTPESFEPGDQFRIATRDPIDDSRISHEVKVSDAMPDLDGTPTLHIGSEVHQGIDVPHGTSCQMDAYAAIRTLEITLPQALEPYRDLFVYQTYVDGEPWRPSANTCSSTRVGRSWQRDAGTDLLAVGCAYQYDEDGKHTGLLEDGKHDVEMRVFLPNNPDAIWTTDVETTQLSCADVCVTYDEETSNFVSCDAPKDDAGCASTSRPSSALWGLALLALLLRLRRREGCDLAR